MVKKTIILLVLYFLQFYLSSLRGKEYFAKEPEPGVFEAGAAWKKNQEPEPEPELLGKKNQEPEPEPEPKPEPLEKKSGAGGLKNLPTPQPWKIYL